MDSSIPTDSPVLRLSYRGGSMRGTFVDGDCLWVSSVPLDSLQRGDVVAFDSKGKGVAHRIVGRDATGFRMQGDGNLRCDSVPLTPDRLIGKVVERERSGIRSIVAGGIRGWRRARILHVRCRLRKSLLFPLAPLYRYLRASRCISRWWRPQILSARFFCHGGSRTKFIHQGRTVAVWIPHENQWMCRKPYDLVLFPPHP